MRGLEIPEPEEDFAADPVELFFDLAYVFAFSQLVALILHDATWHGIGEAGLLLLLLWLPWSQFTWSANAVSGNSRRARVLFLLATTASVPMAASITTALGAGGLLFALPLAAIFLLALAMMVLSLPSDSNVRRSALRYAAPSACAMALIVLGAFFHGDVRVVIWIAGALTFIGATLVAGTGEWIVRTGHFAERHGLIIIIALGEVIVALGNSVVIPLANDEGVPGATVATLIGAGILAGLLWWSYFDRVQPALEHRAERFTGIELGRYVRDVYTYAHFPLVAGIVLTAVALETVTLHPTEPLSLTYRMIGAGGFALFFGGSGIAVYRAFGVVANERVVAVAVIVAIAFLFADIDAIVLFVAVDVVLFAALAVEHLRIERPGSTQAEKVPTEPSADDRHVGNERPA